MKHPRRRRPRRPALNLADDLARHPLAVKLFAYAWIGLWGYAWIVVIAVIIAVAIYGLIR